MDNDFLFALTVLIERQKRLITTIKALIAENRGIASEAETDNWLQHVNRFESEALGALSNIL